MKRVAHGKGNHFCFQFLKIFLCSIFKYVRAETYLFIFPSIQSVSFIFLHCMLSLYRYLHEENPNFCPSACNPGCDTGDCQGPFDLTL